MRSEKLKFPAMMTIFSQKDYILNTGVIELVVLKVSIDFKEEKLEEIIKNY